MESYQNAEVLSFPVRRILHWVAVSQILILKGNDCVAYKNLSGNVIFHLFHCKGRKLQIAGMKFPSATTANDTSRNQALQSPSASCASKFHTCFPCFLLVLSSSLLILPFLILSKLLLFFIPGFLLRSKKLPESRSDIHSPQTHPGCKQKFRLPELLLVSYFGSLCSYQ